MDAQPTELPRPQQNELKLFNSKLARFSDKVSFFRGKRPNGFNTGSSDSIIKYNEFQPLHGYNSTSQCNQEFLSRQSNLNNQVTQFEWKCWNLTRRGSYCVDVESNEPLEQVDKLFFRVLCVEIMSWVRPIVGRQSADPTFALQAQNIEATTMKRRNKRMHCCCTEDDHHRNKWPTY